MPAPYSLFNTPADTAFPDVELALKEPNGLLAIGGNLSPTRLLNAYHHGIFPWYSDDQPVLWWSPDPRLVLFPERIVLSKSLRKHIRQRPFRITLDHAFTRVMRECAAPRANQNGTWITPEIINAYSQLHEMGYAHSVEAWQDEKLVGGLYGMSIGKIFFGESMFSRQTNASKIAFAYLAKTLQNRHFRLIDCQVETPHLKSLGAENIPRKTFSAYLKQECTDELNEYQWKMEMDLTIL